MQRMFGYIAIGALAILGTGCVTPAQNGALGGGAVGAGLGAIIGGASGNPGVGALIGAGVGATTGALIGDQVDHDRHRDHVHYAPPPPPPTVVYREPAPAPTTHFSQSYRVERGHYEVRLVQGASGEYYEERVWVP